ncbi:MAG TPA: STAS/SEC14 domain-containing protein [Ignavibacteria bacterium]|nr:STAS/SEC14 domain-containing protein [Ignavibacteria bacterium]HMQ98648.1 STAS/SEC14 domain-containing protein [Ignavibacteria bacterium]
MPFKINTATNPDRIEVTYSGVVSDEEFRRAIAEFIEFNSRKKCLLVLTDLREMTVTPSILNVYDSINMFEKMGIDNRTSEALILPENKFIEKNIKFYENACLNRGYNVRIFYNREDAIAWLKMHE